MPCCEDREKRKDECSRPEHLKDKPENCSEEQIRSCHGEDIEKHPCCCEDSK